MLKCRGKKSNGCQLRWEGERRGWTHQHAPVPRKRKVESRAAASSAWKFFLVKLTGMGWLHAKVMGKEEKKNTHSTFMNWVKWSESQSIKSCEVTNDLSIIPILTKEKKKQASKQTKNRNKQISAQIIVAHWIPFFEEEFFAKQRWKQGNNTLIRQK